MAKMIDYDWQGHSQGRSHKYPWSEWLNGQSWEIERGVDFHIGDASLRAAVSSAARSRGLKARVAFQSDGVYVITAAKETEEN